MTLIDKIIYEIERFDEEKSHLKSVMPYITHTRSNGIIFFKPELNQVSPKTMRFILNHFNSLARKYFIELKSAYIISGQFLLENNILNKIYNPIKENSLLNFKVSEIKTPFLFSEIIKKYNNTQAVIGGLFLAQNGYSPSILIDIWLNNKVIKLSDNLYITSCKLDDKEIILVNGFYPYQLDQYKNSKIVFFTFKTKTSLETLKYYFQGSIDETVRYKGSIRQNLFNLHAKGLIGEFNSSKNGIHLSGTEQEGKYEVQIFTKAINKYFTKRS